MFAALDLPFFGFTCLGFLAICVVLAIAVWIWVQSGEKGATKLNGGAGCAIGGALIFVAGLMAVGCAVVLVVDIARETKKEFGDQLAQWQIEAQDDHELGSEDEDAESMDEDGHDGAVHDADRHDASDHEHAHSGEHGATQPSDAAQLVEMHVRFHTQSDDAIARGRKWMREHVEADLTTAHEVTTDPHGVLSRTLDFSFDLPAAKADVVEKALREEWPDLKLPDGGSIELRRSPR